tara:strand:+ start:920 stop:1117 length:198 start_codon:yes stop_codon:yes gene_type:complete
MDSEEMARLKGEMGALSQGDIVRLGGKKAAALSLRSKYKKKKRKKRLIEVHCAEGVSEAECYGEE